MGFNDRSEFPRRFFTDATLDTTIRTVSEEAVDMVWCEISDPTSATIVTFKNDDNDPYFTISLGAAASRARIPGCRFAEGLKLSATVSCHITLAYTGTTTVTRVVA